MLYGPAVRNTNPGDSHESIRANPFADKKKLDFHSVRAIRANRLEPAIRNYSVPRKAIRKREGSASA